MPMTSFIEGAHAGQRLAEPIARGIEDRAHMGLRGELDAEERRVAEAERQLRRELQEMRMRESAVRQEFEKERLDRLRRENQPVEEAARLGEQYAREIAQINELMQDPNLTDSERMALEGRRAGIDTYMQGKRSQFEKGEPEATVTRKMPDGTTVRYNVPVSQLEEQFPSGEAGGPPQEKRERPIQIFGREYRLPMTEDQYFEVLDWLATPRAQALSEDRQIREVLRKLQQPGSGPGVLRSIDTPAMPAEDEERLREIDQAIQDARNQPRTRRTEERIENLRVDRERLLQRHGGGGGDPSAMADIHGAAAAGEAGSLRERVAARLAIARGRRDNFRRELEGEREGWKSWTAGGASAGGMMGDDHIRRRIRELDEEIGMLEEQMAELEERG
jgi:hypothetical protein